ALGSIVHDTAQVGGSVGGFSPTGAVTFQFFSGADCTSGASIATANAVDASSGDPRSVDTSALAVGHYGFKATVAADANFTTKTSACEPFDVGTSAARRGGKDYGASQAQGHEGSYID